MPGATCPVERAGKMPFLKLQGPGVTFDSLMGRASRFPATQPCGGNLVVVCGRHLLSSSACWEPLYHSSPCIGMHAQGAATALRLEQQAQQLAGSQGM